MVKELHDYLGGLCRGKRVLIVGFGREGASTLEVLKKILPDQEIDILDQNKEYSIDKIDPRFDINTYDIVFKSPGVPMSQFNLNNLLEEQRLTSQTNIFLELFRDHIIGVTGTKGKSTTSSLIHAVLQNAGYKSALIGNIGIPFFSVFDRDDVVPDYFVCELSSHQLELVAHSPKYAILTNIYEEHLDFYNSFKDYQDAKFNIFKYQRYEDYAIYCTDSPILHERVHNFLHAKNIFKYSLIDWDHIIDENKLSIKGDHNKQNILATLKIAEILHIPFDKFIEAVLNFKGLAHRMEFVAEKNNIDFYNDSIATIPEASMYAIKSLPNIGTLIVGGMDRGIDYHPLVEFLSKSQIDNIICIDEVGKKIYKLLEKEKNNINLYIVDSMEEAVQIAFEKTPQNKACLLSPAAASYGMFKNFEERGAKFRELVLKDKLF